MSLRIGIQGLEASYSEAALKNAEPNSSVLYSQTFADVFVALALGKIDKAFLPFENSTAGFIAENFQLLFGSGFYVSAEHLHPVEHCLLGPKGSRITDIKKVISHPQALAQCSQYLKSKGIEGEVYFDTAGAAADVSKLSGTAAIASLRAAEVYDLEVLDRNINDVKGNWTRFFTIGKNLSWSNRALYATDVKGFQNLAKDLDGLRIVSILSQPIAAHAWTHRYFVELAADDAAAFKKLLDKHEDLKVLGSLDAKR